MAINLNLNLIVIAGRPARVINLNLNLIIIAGRPARVINLNIRIIAGRPARVINLNLNLIIIAGRPTLLLPNPRLPHPTTHSTCRKELGAGPTGSHCLCAQKVEDILQS